MATPRSTRNPLFLGRWFQDEVIIVAIRWYLTYPLSYRQVCDMLRDRGVSVAPSTVMRWVLRYAPEFEKRWQGYEKPMALSWRVDETYIKVGGRWTYLYRAVDQNGQNVDSFLRQRRDVGASKTLFRRALQKHGDPAWSKCSNSLRNHSLLSVEEEHNHMGAAFGLRYRFGQRGTPAAE